MVTSRTLAMLFVCAFVAALASNSAFAAGSDPHEVNYRVGFINKRGEFAIAPRFQYAQDFADGIAMVTMPGTDREFYGVDRNGAVHSGKTERARQFFHSLYNAAIVNGPSNEVQSTSYLNEYLGQIFARDRKGFESDCRLVNSKLEATEALWTYVNEKGKPTFSKRLTDAGTFTEGLANASNISGSGFIDKAGKWVVAPKYYVTRNFSQGLAAVSQSREFPRCPYMTLEAVPEQPGLTPLRYGFIDRNGTQVIPPVFWSARNFSEGVAAVAFDLTDNTESFGYIDKHGKTVVHPQYSRATDVHNGVAAAQKFHTMYSRSTGGCLVISREKSYPLNVFIGKSNNPDPAIASQLRPIATSKYIDAKFGFENGNGVVVIKPIYDSVDRFSNGIAAVQIRDFWGLIDAHGTSVIAPQFEDTHPFDKGTARVKKNGAWLLIDITGNRITNHDFADIGEFSEGLAVVKDLASSKYGFINAQGKIVIPPTFSAVRSFKNGYAAVKLDNAWGFIDKSGKIVVAPKYIDVRDFGEGIAAVREH